MTSPALLPPLQYAAVNGLRLAYRALGSGHPLICLMGFSAGMDMWPRRMLERLSQLRRVLILDNRGMGHSGGADAPYPFDDLARDALELLDRLGHGKADVLGFSMGSDIALAMLRLAPGRFTKAVLYGGGPGGQDEIVPQERVRMVFRAQGEPRGRASAMFRLMFPESWLQGRDLRKIIPRQSAPVRREAVARQIQAVRSRPSESAALSGIAVPVLLVTGSEDQLTPPENSRFMARRIPRATLVEIQGAGHGLMYQYPDTFLKYLEGFLASA